MSLEDYLKQLCQEEEAVKHSKLLRLSGLSAEELPVFNTEWPPVPTPTKLDLLTWMVDLSEDNAELDFTDVYKFCLNDGDEGVREKAARGLWDCDDRSIIGPLIGMLKEDPSPRVRAAAGISLRKFAIMAQEGKLRPRDTDRIRDALVFAIEREGEDLEVRRRAIEAIASIEGPAAAEIIEAAYHSGDAELTQSAVYAMGQSSDTRWLPAVLVEMDSDDPGTRYEAATAGGLLGDESTIPDLIRLVTDEDTQVQVAAVHSVGMIGGPLAKRALEQCLTMEDDAIQEAAESALLNVEFDADPLAFRFQV